jgi:hypothetical protein
MDGWCSGPLRRYTWTRDGGGWDRTDERDYAEDVSTIRVIEPGD